MPIPLNVGLIWEIEDENNRARELKFARYPDEPGVTSCFIFGQKGPHSFLGKIGEPWRQKGRELDSSSAGEHSRT